MNVLVVHAHPEPKYFNGALTRTAIRALREHGHTVEVSDLYAMKWKPAADADDYAGPREDEDYLRIDREQTFAHEAATTACDIVTEQAKVRRADLVLFPVPDVVVRASRHPQGLVRPRLHQELRLPPRPQVRHRAHGREARDGLSYNGHVGGYLRA